MANSNPSLPEGDDDNYVRDCMQRWFNRGYERPQSAFDALIEASFTAQERRSLDEHGVLPASSTEPVPAADDKDASALEDIQRFYDRRRD